MKKKKICFVVAQSGTANAFFKMPIQKLEAEFDIYLVANIKNKEEVANLPIKGYRSIGIERRPSLFADLKSLWQLYRYFREEKFFSVHSMASKPSLLTSIAGFFARVPHRIRIFTGQLWCNMTGWKRYFFKSIDRMTVLLNTEVLADGHPQARYLIDQKVVSSFKIKVLANGSICGVDLERFQFNEKVRANIRSELRLTDKVVYVFLGRLKREKGVRELLSAYNQIVPQCTNAVLLLVGPDEENCASWVKDYPNLKDNENIILYGFTTTPNDLLMAGDVFCNPSYREGFGLSVLEASCLGLPVICSDIYGMEDTFVHEETGLRCKVMDDKSLAEQMLRLYSDAELRKQLGVNGHNRVVKDFSKELVTSAWLDYYRSLR